MIRSAAGSIVLLSLLFAPTALPTPSAPPTTAAVADDRVATVVDRQGLAVVRPAGRQRWTPLQPKSLLLPGDTVRTDLRGANAVELELAAGGTLVLGPGSLLELVDATTLHLLHGELELTPTKAAALRLTGPGGFDRTFEQAATVRATEQATELLAQAPRWLTGYRSSTTDEWLGSLLAKVDGRDVPLHLGYHKVDVTIADQLCETVIEESFVNNTAATLEGVFRFPLPADAAISGFGMWVGSELIEADVVEKQRARQIYEEILRRKQDPGLLEWAGGNVFQANVYPIPPHGEKRIRIRYTQVLAREGALLRYRYALRSELTRVHPLRQLQIAVSVHSQTQLGAIRSPTHELQLQQGEHTATARFEAQDYTPERDFELQIPLAAVPPVVASTHVQDGEGFFLAWLSLPTEQAGWQRDLTPDGPPLDVLLVADTSGSMGAADRQAQGQFAAALLQLLSPQDRFRLLCCDVAPHWWQREPVAADAEHRRDALAFLDQRASLGWTDLDAAFAAVAAASGKDTVVVYVGDGIPTAGDADAAAFAQRLLPLRGKARFHAVATGSSYDSTVLAAIAGLGGSMRTLDEAPADTALALLDEVARPALQDVRVQFARLRTAAVHPSLLPNLPRGKQQVVVGRFDPLAPIDKPPSITVTGTLGGEQRQFTALVETHADDGGNTLLPRLWARAHVQALLAEGGGRAAQQEVVAVSQRYGIITPFTSLLVLENEADRQEFGVARTVHGADGEALFAQARDAAATEALRAAMQQAKSYRLQLRLQALQEIRELGGDLYGWHVAEGRMPQSRALGLDLNGFGEGTGGWGGDAGDLGRLKDGIETEFRLEAGEKMPAPMTAAPAGNAAEPASPPAELSVAESAFDDLDWLQDHKEVARRQAGRAGNYRGPSDIGPYGGRGLRPALRQPPWFGFPALAEAAAVPTPHPDPDWPQPVLDLLRGLDRRPLLQQLGTPLQLRLIVTDVDADSQLLLQQTAELLWQRDGWLLRHGGAPSQPRERLDWLHGGERGVLALAAGLGRQRPAADADRRWPGPSLPGLCTDDLLVDYRHWRGRVLQRTDAVVTVELRAPDHATSMQFDVDPVRQLLLERRQLHEGHLQRRWRYGGVVEAAGAAWVTTVVAEDLTSASAGQTQRLELQELGADAAVAVAGQWLEPRLQAVLLPVELPDADAALDAVQGGDATFAAHFRLMQLRAGLQQWPAARAAFERAAALLGDRPGRAWLQAQLLVMARAGDDAVAAVERLAAGIAAAGGEDAALRAVQLCEQLTAGFAAEVRLRLQAQLDGTVQRSDDALRRFRWQLLRLRTFEAAGQRQPALALAAALAEQLPNAPRPRLERARLLADLGQRPQAIAVLQAALQAPWPQLARDQLFAALTDQLWHERDLAGLLAATQRQVAADGPLPPPHDADAWLRWLSVPRLAGEDAAADRWLQNLAAAPLDPDADLLQRAQLRAALQFALGQGWNFHKYELGDGEVERTMALLRPLLQLEHGGFELARIALDHWRFRRSDAFRQLQAQLAAALLQPGAAAAMPLDRLLGSVSAVDWSQQPDADRRRLAASLTERWQQGDQGDRLLLAGAVLQLLGDDREQVLAFRRLRLQQSRAVDRAARARELFEQLAGQPWTEAGQQDLLALLPQLADPWQPRQQQVLMLGGGVRKLAEALLAARQQALLGDEAALRQQPRAAQRSARAAARQQALRQLATALAAAAEAAEAGPLRHLLTTEALCLRVRAEAGEPAAALHAVAAAAAQHAVQLRQQPEATLHDEQRQRCRLVLAFAACAGKADAALVDAALRCYRELEAVPQERDTGRFAEVRLLLALDREEQLRAALQGFLRQGHVDRDWRALLALLQAEGGDVAAAVATLQPLERDDLLAAAELATLADWRLVLGDDAGRAAAQRRSFLAMSTQQLEQRCHQARNRVERRGAEVPGDIEPETVLALQALLAKAERPDHELWYLRSLYEATKDHRLLAALADGVPGHDHVAVFAFLQDAQDLLLQVHEEAALQALHARALALQADAGDELDRRGLQWLALLASLRAAEVPGADAARGPALQQEFLAAAAVPPTADTAVGIAALLTKVRAFPGEQGQQACFRLLDACVAVYEAGSERQLQCALSRAAVQWQLGARAAAADGLLPVLADQRAAAGGALPPRAQAAVERAQQYCLELGRYTAWERELLAEIERQPQGNLRRALVRLRMQLFAHCLQHGGSCSLGQGPELYRRARAELEQRIAPPAQPGRGEPAGASELPELVQALCELCRAAQEKQVVATAADDLYAFASGPLLAQLPRLPRQHPDVLQHVATALAKLDAPLMALRLLVLRASTEPRWLQRLGDDGWRQFHYAMAGYRVKCSDLGDVEPPLRRLVLTALEQQLQSQDDTGDEFWDRDNGRFWAALAPAYFETAQQVLQTSVDRPAVQYFVARYLWSGLYRKPEAIAVLLALDARAQLQLDWRWQLVRWLHDERRFADSLRHLETLIAAHADRLEYRVAMVTALHRTGDDARARELLLASEQRLRQAAPTDTAPPPAALAQLGLCAVDCGFADAAVRLLGDAIAGREQQVALTRAGDDTRARWYVGLSQAHGRLGAADAAIEAAGAAIVCAGRDDSVRSAATEALAAAVGAIAELDPYVAARDRRTDQSGLDSPVVRQALAAEYVRRGKLEAALQHYRIAQRLQDDRQVRQQLASVLDKLGRPRDAAAELQQALVDNPADAALALELAQRFEQLGDDAAAERARTQLVEPQTADAAGHRALAELRQQQGQYRQAVEQWRLVVQRRTFEPDGWLALAGAAAAAGDQQAARQALQHVLDTDWPQRFGDVRQRAKQQLQALGGG